MDWTGWTREIARLRRQSQRWRRLAVERSGGDVEARSARSIVAEARAIGGRERSGELERVRRRVAA
jgi:hypothetical protein